ncbi:hypothetical protein RF11_09448 [Thelohanellus kitauei]|uniref:Alpha-(1,6)-fucosyltransferase N- and catalytic domain-containing protein n=1 Tax=Thelohanellus kitauei TaxID=669202 RepID=A0A0C2MNK2_THEKT|nr:hypothetical protein RF11_09448 [Thelohanellus kitauei]
MENENFICGRIFFGLAKRIVKNFYAQYQKDFTITAMLFLRDFFLGRKTGMDYSEFGSYVCRLAFEWMNGQKADSSRNIDSVDDIYYYARQKKVSYSLVLNHSVGNQTFYTTSRVYLHDYNFGRYRTVEIADSPEEYKIPGYKLKENLLYTNFKAFEDVNL